MLAMARSLALCSALTVASGVAEARPLTPHDLVSLSRIAHPVVSPEGRWLVWEQQDARTAKAESQRHLWRLDLTRARARPQMLALGAKEDDSDPEFGSDGRIYFLSDRGGGAGAVWRTRPAGGPVERVTPNLGILGFRISPRCDQLLVWAGRPIGTAKLIEMTNKTTARADTPRVYDQLPVRFWDKWKNGERSQLFVIPLVNGRAAEAGHSIEGNLIGDVPSPRGAGRDELAWSPNGREVYFTMREAGSIEPLSTNFDLFAVPADATKPPINLTAGNEAIDTQPAVSPDGTSLAWLATERPGYENDRHVLMVRNLETGSTRAVSSSWDRSIDALQWSPDSSSVYVTAQDGPDHPLFRIITASGAIERLSGAGYVGDFVVLPSGGVVYALDSLTAPADLWRLAGRGAPIRLTSVNAAKLAGVEWPIVSRFAFKGAEGADVHAIALLPGAARLGKIPVLMLVHGGPQNSFSDHWAYLANTAVFTGAGLGVVAINFHGSTGYGQAFTDSVRNDWGGKPLVDLKLGLEAALSRFPQLDGSRTCAAGGSYGGFMMNWIEGKWPERFRCLVQAEGVFDTRAMTYETDDLRADEWDFGNRPYHEAPSRYEEWSPVHYVANWQTPMLVLTGEQDFRTPSTQAIAAFTALQERGVPSKLVVFPDEGHSVAKPEDILAWYAQVLGWLHRYTLASNSLPTDATPPASNRN